MSDIDRSNYDEGADPSEDIKKLNPDETTVADLTDDDDEEAGDGNSQPDEDANFNDDTDPDDVSGLPKASLYSDRD